MFTQAKTHLLAFTLLTISGLTTQAAIPDDPSPAMPAMVSSASLLTLSPTYSPCFLSPLPSKLTIIFRNQNAPARHRRNGPVPALSRISAQGMGSTKVDARVYLMWKEQVVLIRLVVGPSSQILRRGWVGMWMLRGIFWRCVWRRLVLVREGFWGLDIFICFFLSVMHLIWMVR